MNGPEILHLIRHDLLRAVAERGAPPTQQPMDVSPWVGMSAMQKAIRRGREDLALSAAATLLRDAPDKLWRIGGIAYEDVGVASLGTIGLATASLGGKQARAALGGEWAVASCVIAELSRALKCRAADDLLMACELHPAYAEVRAELPYLTTRDLITVVTAQGSVHDRASRGRSATNFPPRMSDSRRIIRPLACSFATNSDGKGRQPCLLLNILTAKTLALLFRRCCVDFLSSA